MIFYDPSDQLWWIDYDEFFMMHYLISHQRADFNIIYFKIDSDFVGVGTAKAGSVYLVHTPA